MGHALPADHAGHRERERGVREGAVHEARPDAEGGHLRRSRMRRLARHAQIPDARGMIITGPDVKF